MSKINFKIFGIGLPKTCLTSLTEALSRCDLRVGQFLSDEDLVDLSDYDFVCDSPLPARYQQFYERYPTARFICTLRDERQWLESARFWFSRPASVASTPELQERVRTRRLEVFGTEVFDEALFLEKYRQHRKEVTTFFSGAKAAQLLWLDIPKLGNQAWRPLLRFLEIDDADPRKLKSFPVKNVKKKQQEALCYTKYKSLQQGKWKRNKKRGDGVCSSFLHTVCQYPFEKILDIGAGRDTLAPTAFLDSGAQEVHAIGLQESPKFENPSYVYHRQHFEEFADEREECYDALWASHVLEHQRNPGEFLDRCFKLLKPGGWLFIGVPILKHNIVGGHVTLWNLGLLMYQLLLAKFDTRYGRYLRWKYSCFAIVQKPKYPVCLPDPLYHDKGDIERLASYWPINIPFKQCINGNFLQANWERKHKREIAFVVHSHKGKISKLDRMLSRLRMFYPFERVLLIADGDESPKLEELAVTYGCDFHRGERLKLIAKKGLWWKRICELFFEEPTKYLIKLDYDSELCRPFKYIPDADFFGEVHFHQKWKRYYIAGFCKGFSERAIRKIYESGLLEHNGFFGNKHMSYKGNLLCEDFLTAKLADKLKFQMVHWTEPRFFVKIKSKESSRIRRKTYAVVNYSSYTPKESVIRF